MSDFPKDRNEAGQSSGSMATDELGEEQVASSQTTSNGRNGDVYSAIDEEKNPMLTKVADLLDDIVEIGREPTPSLNEKWESSLDNQKGTAAPSANRRDLGRTEASISPGESGPINANQFDHSMGAIETPETDNVDEITIRGRGDGVAIELGKGDWSHMVANLDRRLAQASSFFRGGQVSLDTGSRPLVEPELDQVSAIFHKYSLTVGIVCTSSERTFQSAMTLGLASTLNNSDHEARTEATYAASNLGGQTHFVYRGNLRSGQVLRKQESIVVIGDINPGGNVISSGDIFIWGRLRGVAHAGAEGNVNAMISALMLEPTQLRIANLIAVGPGQSNGRPREKRDPNNPVVPQVAFVSEGKLVIRPWQQARRGFRSVLLADQ